MNRLNRLSGAMFIQPNDTLETTTILLNKSSVNWAISSDDNIWRALQSKIYYRPGGYFAAGMCSSSSAPLDPGYITVFQLAYRACLSRHSCIDVSPCCTRACSNSCSARSFAGCSYVLVSFSRFQQYPGILMSHQRHTLVIYAAPRYHNSIPMLLRSYMLGGQ